ncbi:hypothetical protein EON77_08590 [bacterium]|nr:MAG: hypothetical protein EON77_08590 [bacterium]
MSNDTNKKSDEKVTNEIQPAKSPIPGSEAIEEVGESDLDALAGGVGKGLPVMEGECTVTCIVTTICTAVSSVTK